MVSITVEASMILPGAQTVGLSFRRLDSAVFVSECRVVRITQADATKCVAYTLLRKDVERCDKSVNVLATASHAVAPLPENLCARAMPRKVVGTEPLNYSIGLQYVAQCTLILGRPATTVASGNDVPEADEIPVNLSGK
eukprot:809227-Amphidinium_carterae.1